MGDELHSNDGEAVRKSSMSIHLNHEIVLGQSLEHRAEIGGRSCICRLGATDSGISPMRIPMTPHSASQKIFTSRSELGRRISWIAALSHESSITGAPKRPGRTV